VDVHAPGEDEARRLMSCSTEFMRKDTQRRGIVSRRLVAVWHTRNRRGNASAKRASLIRTLSAIFELKCSVQGTLSRFQHFLRSTLIVRVAVLPRGVT
jgi:hypothetical protein